MSGRISLATIFTGRISNSRDLRPGQRHTLVKIAPNGRESEIIKIGGNNRISVRMD
jgi:hypothetical protein